MNSEQHPLTLVFKDPELEKAYLLDNAHKSLFQVRLAALLGIVLYPGFAFLDYMFFPNHFMPFLIIRLSVTLIFFICFFLTFKKPFLIEKIIIIGITSAQIGHYFLMYFAKDFPDYGYGITIIIIVFLFTFTRIQYIKSVILSTCFILIYEWMVIFVLDYPLAIILKNNFFLLSVFTAGLLSGYVIERYIRSDFLQSLKLEEKNAIIKANNNQLMEELKLAKKIQQSLIPSLLEPFRGIELASFYKPMKDIGGDFYDLFYIGNEKKIGIFISDVSGHGVPAALITSMLKTLIETSGNLKESPKNLLSFINNKLLGQTGGNFLTAFYGIYNMQNYSFTYARGAHNPPFLIRNHEIIPLEGKGKILGVFEDILLEEKTIELKPKDKLIFYTDGLTEASDKNGSEFETFLPEILLKNCDSRVDKILENLFSRLLSHREKEDFEDDICIIAVEIQPEWFSSL